MPPHPLSDARVGRVLDIIDSIELPYPSTYLLTALIHGALDPVSAAGYVGDRLSGGDARSLVSDWIYILECITRNGSLPEPPDAHAQRAITRRDGGRCCITGKNGSIFDPLCVVPILPIPVGWVTEEKRVFDMLGAFFGPQYRDWWFDYVKDPGYITPYANHWLVRRSASTAFANGFVHLQRLNSSMIEYSVEYVEIGPEGRIAVDGDLPLLGDHSRSGIKKVDARFIGTHARLCASIRFLDIARHIAPQILDGSLLPPLAPRPRSSLRGWPIRHVVSTALSTILPFTAMGNAILTLWLFVPKRARIATYGLMREIGKVLYGTHTSYVQRLPFGLYLKFHSGADTYRNEFNALRLVRQYTTVPVPKPLDVTIPHKQTSRTSILSADAYLLMTRLPGLPLADCQHILSDKDRERIIDQMRDYLTQIRSIPNLVNQDNPICNAVGEAIRDSRIRGETPVGPFPDEASFSQMLRFSDETGRRGHNIVFTHADLNPRNILVDFATHEDGTRGWGVTGIVDWEFAGYYPEYWDFTKALFEGFRWIKRYNDMVKEIFKEFGDYSRELDVESRAWGTGDGV
ncbi:kinase-like domain-containing protein [Xylaria longipes]|nr:kinase-like domain-containing protein [Xylaria longipes]